MRAARSLLAVAAVLLAALPGPSRAATEPDGYAWRVLTGGPERFTLIAEAGGVTVRSESPGVPVLPFWNRRQILVAHGAEATEDQTVCATWVRQSRWSNQEGLAVRVRRAGGRLHALTLTKNVFAHSTWWINLLSWHGETFTTLAQFDLSDVVSVDSERVRPFPWRVCLRAAGTRLGFKVWLPRHESEPAWDDAAHTRWTRVGQTEGVPGWYVGHLAPGDRVTYRGLTTS